MLASLEELLLLLGRVQEASALHEAERELWTAIARQEALPMPLIDDGTATATAAADAAAAASGVEPTAGASTSCHHSALFSPGEIELQNAALLRLWNWPASNDAPQPAGAGAGGAAGGAGAGEGEDEEGGEDDGDGVDGDDAKAAGSARRNKKALQQQSLKQLRQEAAGVAPAAAAAAAADKQPQKTSSSSTSNNACTGPAELPPLKRLTDPTVPLPALGELDE